LLDRPKPTTGCSANGRRRRRRMNEWMNEWMAEWITIQPIIPRKQRSSNTATSQQTAVHTHVRQKTLQSCDSKILHSHRKIQPML
jgi:hypothetical protein